jgi:hypothetical protein
MNRRERLSAAAITLISFVFSACGREVAPEPDRVAPVAVAASALVPTGGATTPAKDERPVPGARMIVSEAKLSIRCAHPEGEADAVGRFVAEAGGYVVNREADRSDETVKNVAMTLRVPAPKFESALAELRGHGTVLTESATGRDVTEEFTDTEAQLKSKRRLEDRLLHIVDGSGSVKDMLEVENELTRVRTDIERLEGHSRLLTNQTAFATIQATFVSPAQPIVHDGESVGSRFANAFRTAGGVFVAVATGLIVGVGALGPVALPAGALYLIVRRRRRFAPASAAE